MIQSMEKIVCPISGETPHEEHINALTHFFGFCLSLVGFVVLFTSQGKHDFIFWLGCLLYGVTLVCLYAASTYYHRCRSLKLKSILRVVDHVCIYLLIAGSYTPFTLGPLRELGGIPLFWTVWCLALAGIVMKIIDISRFEIFSLIMYLGMGWLGVYYFPSLVKSLSGASFFWLVCGGISYSLGTIFYVWQNLTYNHAIWHLFVLFGSLCHFLSILGI